jgi:predicted NAD/FAD-binding protein
VTWQHGGPEDFDAVVLAAHADQTLAMLADASDAERDILGAFPYQQNEAVLQPSRSDGSPFPLRKPGDKTAGGPLVLAVVLAARPNRLASPDISNRS